MGRNHNNLKRGAGEYKFAMPFEELDGGGELHRDREVRDSVLARGRAALKLFSMGEA